MSQKPIDAQVDISICEIRIRSVIRSYTFRRSFHTFQHIFLLISIRSYTFRANPPGKWKRVFKNTTHWSRSVTFMTYPSTFCSELLGSYTFLYVPDNPSSKSNKIYYFYIRSYTFLATPPANQGTKLFGYSKCAVLPFITFRHVPGQPSKA